MKLDWQAVSDQLARLERGDGAALAEARATASVLAPAPERQAWAMAVDAADWFWRPSSTPPPTPEDVTSLAGRGPGRPGVEAAVRQVCAIMERAAVTDFDPTTLARWIDARGPMVQAGGPAETVAWQLARCWKQILDGERPIAAVEAVRAAASAMGLASAVVEATVLAALALSASGDIPRALAQGRRAALMAGSEALPQQEFLAALLLARLRRHAGSPHLSARILSLLMPSLTWRWRPWAQWELALAGGGQEGGGAEMTGDEGRASRLRAVVGAALGGDRAGFVDAARRLRHAVGGCAFLRADAEAVLAGLDPEIAAGPDVAAWRSGDSAGLPGAIVGLGTVVGRQALASRAYVVGAPGVPGARVLPAGVALFEGAHPGAGRLLTRGEAAEGTRAESHEERTLAGVAALVLSGPAGQSHGDFFRRVYGFAFVPHLHGATLRVLLSRVRKAAQGMGEVASGDDRVALALEIPLVVADPRCAEPVEARVARYLASAGGTSTETAAADLTMPVRTTRAILSRLVEAGVCQVQREGRQVRYAVDDTVLTQLTPITGL